MSQGSQDKVGVGVVRGINSEASLINFPVDEFVVDEENFVLTRRGSHNRRLGVDYEPAYELSSALMTSPFYEEGGVSTFLWKDVNGDSERAVVVVQEGNRLRFYKYRESSISANDYGVSIDLNEFLLPGQEEAGLFECQMAEGFGMLFVTNRAIKPLLITFVPDSEAFVAKPINIKIRDFKGIDDGLAVDQRVSFITDQHRYNLQNQGWPNGRINSFRSDRGVYPSNADIWYHGKYVDVDTGREAWSASEVVNQSFGTSQAPQGSKFIEPLKREISTQTSEDLDEPKEILDINYVNSTGEAIISLASLGNITTGDIVTFSGTRAYDDGIGTPITSSPIWTGVGSRTRTTSTRTYYEPLDGREFTVVGATSNSIIVTVSIAVTKTITGDPKDISWEESGGSFGQVRKVNIENNLGEANSIEGYSAVEFSQGRAWYAGLGTDEYASYVFFSRTLEDPSLAGQCYQEADPTSEHISDLIDTDGGYIVIPEAGKILKLMAYDRFIIVFGTRGIWSISGRDAVFTATGYEVSKISSISILGLNTIENVEGTPIFFAEQGIYAITGDQVTGQLKANSLSIQAFQTEYENIPYLSRKNAKAVYDGIEKNIYWFYKGADNFSPYKYDFDRAIIFSGVNEGFTKFKIERPDQADFPLIASAFPSSLEFTENLQLDVLVDGELVQADGDDVFVNFDVSAAGSPGIILYTAVPTENGVQRVFSRFTNSDFVDWGEFDGGTPYSSFIMTGWDVYGDLMREKQVQWLYVFFDKTEDGFDVDFNPTGESGCLASVYFAWANNKEGKIWGPEQAYDLREFYIPDSVTDPYDTGFPIAYKKLKPRGSGKAVQMRFESEAGKDCKLLGWSSHITGNTRV